MTYEFYLTDAHLNPTPEENPMPEFIAQLRHVSRNGEHIRIYVDTHGGDLHACLALVDVLDSLPGQVDLVAQGKCMSAGMILMAVHRKGLRMAFPHTVFMWHQAYGTTQGTIEAVKAENAFYERHLGKLYERVHEVTGNAAKDVVEWFERMDTYMDAAEALKHGFIDSILYGDLEGLIEGDDEDTNIDHNEESDGEYNPTPADESEPGYE